jgi:exonuclease III
MTDTVKAPTRKIKIISWNVRSLRHCYRSGSFALFIKSTEAHFIFLQEVSASPTTLLSLPGFMTLLEECGFLYRYWFPCQDKPHYSGTAVLARIKPDFVIKGFLNNVTDDPTPNLEGRAITIVWEGKAIVGSYFPTLSIKQEGKERRVLSRMEYQRQFEQHLAHSIFADKEIILTGDFNTTMNDSDLTYWRKHGKPFPPDFPSTTSMERDFINKIMEKLSLIDAAKSKNGDSRMTFRGSYFLYPGLCDWIYSWYKVILLLRLFKC